MHIKKFFGTNVKDTIKAIKAELGEEALILSTRKIPTGGYEVVAAIEYDLTTPINIDISGAGKGKTYSPQPGREKARHIPPAKDEPRRPAPSKEEGPKSAPSNADVSVSLQKEEFKEIKELKELCLKMIAQANTPASEAFVRLDQEMVKNGIDRDLIKNLLANTFSEISNDKSSDVNYLKSCIKNKLSDRISVVDPIADGNIVAFIGPPGVGKTTTIAKLAAIQALKKKKSVALLTLDTYRIAAAEQLMVYGKIIKVPVEVAKDINDIAAFLKAHEDKDLILIDTSGRSRGNSSHMQELSELAGLSSKIKFSLVLCSHARDEVLYDDARRFPRIDSLTFTKLDEAPFYGPMLNTSLLVGRPIAYLATGQRVPEDIETATKERLLDFFMPN